MKGRVEEVRAPIALTVPGMVSRVRIEPLNRAAITTITAEFWHGALLVTQAAVTGVGAHIQVDRGALTIRTDAPGITVSPLAQAPDATPPN
jgi:hypothetical protein